MKKYLLIFTMSLLGFCATIQAQDEGGFTKGSVDFNIGVGIGATFYDGTAKASLPPIGASLEFGITEKISVGGYIGYSSATSEFSFVDFTGSGTTTYDWTYSYTIVGVRGSYHFAVNNSKLDPYAGVMLGYNVASVDLDGFGGASPSVGGLAYSAYLGARYRFSEKIGVFAELGYGIAYLQLGLNVKFK